MASSKAFKDTSTDCAICLSSLYEAEEEDGGDSDDEKEEEEDILAGDDYDDNRRVRKVLELSCGHVYHLACVRAQLEQARPTHHERLLFSGTRCAKCARFCDHPDLQHLTRSTDLLRAEVDRLVVEQLLVDHPEYRSVLRDEYIDATHTQSSSREKERNHLVEQGRRSYAFYLCSSCQSPYFGGTVECADGDRDGDGGTGGNDLPPADRLCPSCSPPSQSIGCDDPLGHRGFHVWKCRYCCQPGRYVCYGTTHFCEDCHDRNSDHVRSLRGRRLQQNNGRADDEGPPRLEPIPCPGPGRCPFPFPAGSTLHNNGATSACEQVYWCAWCESRHLHGHQHVNHEEPGSRNYVVNPSGEHGLRGWIQHNRHILWQVEPIEIPLPGGDAAAATVPTTTNFVSSFQWCAQSQAVPVAEVLREPARVEARCRYTGRSDCPSVVRMEVLVVGRRDGNDNRNVGAPVLQRVALPELETSPDCWETARIELPDPVDPAVAEAIVLVVAGKDQRFWAGNFGSKVADCTVRVLGDEAELERVLVPDADARMAERERQLQPQTTVDGSSYSASCNIS